jgi:hypothetical protein|tara:strand:+ start:11225 stop:11344 length:120 start_codon:yes stop_codon:yes gene_type:complete
MKILAYQHRGNGHGKGRRKIGKRKRTNRRKIRLAKRNKK